MRRSTPAAASTVGRYLFQSWVSDSAGGVAAGGYLYGDSGGWCRGIVSVRWFVAEAGVRRSKMRRCESEETLERRDGLCGENEAL